MGNIEVTNQEGLSAYKQAVEKDTLLTFDTETESLNCVGDAFMQIGGAAGDAYFVDKRRAHPALWRDFAEASFARVRPVLFHNAPFDLMKIRMGLGIRYLGRVHDTRISSHLLDENTSHKLKDLAEARWPGANAEEQAVKAWLKANNKGKPNYDRVPVEIMHPYACQDVVLTRRLHDDIHPKVHHPLYDTECELVKVLVDMRVTGVRVDVPYLKGLIPAFQSRMADLEAQIHAAAGKVFSVASNPHLADVLYNVLVQPIKILTEKGEPSADREALVGINHPVAGLVLEWRDKAKSLEFIESWLESADANGYIHPSLNQCGTRSGRFSCVTGDTKILTIYGMKEMRYIREGDLVWTHQLRWRRVAGVKSKHDEPVFDVHFSNGNILTCTMSHKLLLSTGVWATLEEILHERVEEMVCQQQGKSSGVVPEVRATSSKDYCEKTWNYVPKREVDSGDLDTRCGASSHEIIKVLQIKNGHPKSYAWEDGRAESSLEGRVPRREGVFNNNLERAPNLCAPGCNVQGARNTADTTGDGCTPYRLEPTEQRDNKSCIGNKFRTQAYTLFTDEGFPSCCIEKVYPAGRDEVYDIGVEEDHSYYSCGVFSHNCSGPNMQQIPKRSESAAILRRAFIYPEGLVGGTTDQSQVEMVGFAHYSKDPTMQNALRKGEDLHKSVMVELGLAPNLESVSKDQRRLGKGTNFSIVYCVGQGTLSTYLSSDQYAGRYVSPEEARELRARYLRRFPKVAEFQKRVSWCVKSRPDHAVKNMFGRIFHLSPEKAYTGVNRIIQGWAGDCMKHSMVEVWKKAQGTDLRLYLNIHDALCWTCREDTFHEHARMVDEGLSKCPFPLDVPMRCETTFSRTNWAEETEYALV